MTMRKASVEELAPFIDIPGDASAICRAQNYWAYDN